MSRKRRMFFRAAHRDKAERAIIDVMKAAGADVYQLNAKDVPDLLVGFRGVTYLAEVKTQGLETTDKRNGKTYTRTTPTREGQKEFLAAWKGGPARVIHTPEEACAMLGLTAEETAAAIVAAAAMQTAKKPRAPRLPRGATPAYREGSP